MFIEFGMGEDIRRYEADTETVRFAEERKNASLFLAETRAEILGEVRSFYRRYQEGIANADNFCVNTIAEFTPMKSRPRRKPDYVSHTRDGKISSEYWYTADGVIRGSKHWGAGIASCDWFLGKQRTQMLGNKQYGKCRWEDFTQKTDIATGHGKAVLTTFANTIGGEKKQFGSNKAIVAGIND